MLMQGRDQAKKRIYWVAGVAAVIVVVLAINFPETSLVDLSSTDPSDTLNRGLIGEPESLDHHNFSSDQSAQVLRDTGEGLVAIAANGDLKPGVAESWTLSEDGLQYTFKIRDSALWSNGSKVTAHDFVSTYRNLVDPSHAAINANAIQAVRNASLIIKGKADVASLGAIAVDDETLLIQLQSPTAYFLQLLSHPSLYPVFVSANSVETSAKLNVSNGAYILSDWTKGSEILLEKNPKYWDKENVFFKSVRYHIVEEGSEFNRFRANELDITGTVDSSVFSLAKRDYPTQLKLAPRLGIYYYGFNLDNPLFSDSLDLRKALSLAVDRQLLVSKVTARGEEPAYSWVPPGTYNYKSQVVSDLNQSDVERVMQARRHLSAAGYGSKNVLRFQLRYNKSDVQERIALAISAMWREVLGAEVELISEEFQVLLSNIREREVTDVFRLSWTGNFNDAENFLELFESEHPQNLSGYSNSKVDSLIQLARSEVDLSKRRLILEEAERIALNDYPVIPIYFYVSKHLVSSRIKGWQSNVLDIHLSQHLWASH